MNSSYIKAWKCGTVRRMHAARLRQEGDVAEIWRFVSSDALGIYARYAKHRKIVKISTRQWCSSEQGVCECVCVCAIHSFMYVRKQGRKIMSIIICTCVIGSLCKSWATGNRHRGAGSPDLGSSLPCIGNMVRGRISNAGTVGNILQHMMMNAYTYALNIKINLVYTYIHT